jgi:hypothetical protein
MSLSDQACVLLLPLGAFLDVLVHALLTFSV